MLLSLTAWHITKVARHCTHFSGKLVGKQSENNDVELY